MAVMEVTFTKLKGHRYLMTVVRERGPELAPRQGPGYHDYLPHDAVALPPGVPSEPPEVNAWLADGVHRHRREGGGVHLIMQERASGELVGSVSLFKTDWEARSSEIGYGVRADRRGRGLRDQGRRRRSPMGPDRRRDAAHPAMRRDR